MFLRCLDEYRTEIEGRPVVFEETHKFGFIYAVDDELGEKLIATGKFAPASEKEAETLPVDLDLRTPPEPEAEAEEV